MAALSFPILLHETAVRFNDIQWTFLHMCPSIITYIAHISSEYFQSPVYLDFWIFVNIAYQGRFVRLILLSCCLNIYVCNLLKIYQLYIIFQEYAYICEKAMNDWLYDNILSSIQKFVDIGARVCTWYRAGVSETQDSCRQCRSTKTHFPSSGLWETRQFRRFFVVAPFDNPIEAPAIFPERRNRGVATPIAVLRWAPRAAM